MIRPNSIAVAFEWSDEDAPEAFFGYLQIVGNAYLEASAFDEVRSDELFVLRPDLIAVIS